MASAPSRKCESGLPHKEIEERLMSEEMDLDARKFYVECEKKGPGFLVAAVRHRKTFQESFDRLVGKGCRPDILFLGLHYLLRSELREKSCQVPRKREIRSLAARLRKGVEEIRAFEKNYAEIHRIRVLNHCFDGPVLDDCELYFNVWSPIQQAEAGTYCVTHHMLAYAEMLQSWYTPRSDALKSYGSIYNCAYAKVATGKPQFSIVAELSSSLLGSCIEPDTLRKNLSRFEQRNRNFYFKMVSDLRYYHGSTDGTSPGPVDWPKLFGAKTDKLK